MGSFPKGGKGCCQGDCQASAECCKKLSTSGKTAISVLEIALVIVLSKYYLCTY